MYKLKPTFESFTVVDGKFAGRTYRAGETYQEIPPEEQHKFDEIKPVKPAKNPEVTNEKLSR